MRRIRTTNWLKTAVLLFLAVFLTADGKAQTLDECQAMAERNYPLIHRYALLDHTIGLTLEGIGKGWLPTITATVQGSVQNKVAALPDAINSMMRAQGYEEEGVSRLQYRAEVDITQPIYDGGSITRQKAVVQAQGEVQKAQNGNDLYRLRQRINELYFGLLLIDNQLEMNRDMQELYRTSEAKLQSMYNHGTASLSDLNVVKAERMGVDQLRTELTAQRRSLAQLLSTFLGKPVGQISRPMLPPAGKHDTHHPELRVLDCQQALNDARQALLRSRVRPRVSFFASGYYGYPGYDIFHDMLHRTPTLNGMFGIRLTWTLSNLFTLKNERQKLEAERLLTENQRQTFLFNNRIEQIQMENTIEKYRQMVAEDEEIVKLRRQIRTAAESRLAHGIIDTHNLVREINSENQALRQQSLHETKLIKALYDLKFILNN